MTKTAATLIKSSFEQRGKRLRLPSTLRERFSAAADNKQLLQFRNCEFWRWDLSIDEHRELYQTGECKCFQCLIGWPVKENIERPLYPWQREIISAFSTHKLCAILKARAIGATELCLRWFLYKTVVNDELRNKNIIIVTGIREQLAIDLVKRFKGLLPDYNWNDREGVAEINGCSVRAYPSMRIKDIRGASSVSHVLIDELDHFNESIDSNQIFGVVEPLIVKSNPQIILCSTPGPINSTMHQLYSLPENECRYHRLYMPITKPLGTLISEEEHEKIKRQPFYQQEMLLKFGSYGTGTIFNIADIDFAMKMGERYNNPKYNPKASHTKYPYIEPHAEFFSIGCDPSGLGHSKFGITLVSVFDNKIHVLASEEHGPNVDEDAMIRRLLSLRNKTPRPTQTRIWIDCANISFIRRLKSCISGEESNYQERIEYMKKHKWIRPGTEEIDMMANGFVVIPVSFAKRGAEMLANVYTFLSRGELVIHPKFMTLISALQSAKNLPTASTTNRSAQFILDKRSASLDILDSLRLALFPMDAGLPSFESEDGGDENQ